MTRFAYRPAPTQDPLVFDLTGTHLSLDGDWSMDLAMAKARFVRQRFGEVWLRQLDLMSNGTTRRLVLRVDAQTAPADMAAHKALLIAVAEALAQAQPDARIALGAEGPARRLLFGLGIVALASAVLLGAVTWLTALPEARALPSMLPLGLLGLLGFALIRGAAPGRAKPTLDAAGFKALLDGLDATAPGTD